MSYYKIAYESDTIEGLKAIQGNSGHGASGTNLASLDTAVPSPPPKQDVQNSDSFLGVVQAPPTANETSAELDKHQMQAPPPATADPTKTDIGLEGEIPPPPIDDLQDQEGNEGLPNEGFFPPL